MVEFNHESMGHTAEGSERSSVALVASTCINHPRFIVAAGEDTIKPLQATSRIFQGKMATLLFSRLGPAHLQEGAALGNGEVVTKEASVEDTAFMVYCGRPGSAALIESAHGGGVADTAATVAGESLDEWMFQEYWQLGGRKPIGDGVYAGCVLRMVLYGALRIECGNAFPERKHVMERVNSCTIAFNVHFQRGEKRQWYGSAACGVGDSSLSFTDA